jgi:hypothetical protein
MNRQVEIKAEQIARMVVKGLPRTRIAIEMGMSYDGLTRIFKCPEYIEIENRVRGTMVGQMDARLAQRAKMETEIEDAVPEAMQVLLDNVRKKRDLRAALEVLDREPSAQFAKRKPEERAELKPGISSEALASALREADLTHKIMKHASSFGADSPESEPTVN